MTSQQPYHELQLALRQKEAVELENAELKRRLVSVASLVTPVLDHQQPAPPHQEASKQLRPQQPQQLHLPHTQRLSGHAPPLQPPEALAVGSDVPYPSPSHAYGPGQAVHSPHGNLSPPRSVASPHSTSGWHCAYPPLVPEAPITPQSRTAFPPRYDFAQGLTIGQERLGLEFLLAGNQRISTMASGVKSNPHSPSPYYPPPRHDAGMPQNSRAGARVHALTPIDDLANTGGQELVAHLTPIRNAPPTCPLDSILLDFLRERQQQAADGVATPKLVGPAYPSVASLLNPAVESHPLSKVFTDILGTFPDLSTLPEKVAVLYVMFLIMRWQIAPTQENYDRLPDWVTPRPSQLFTPHPAWVDHLPFPYMRDKLVRDWALPEYAFENFFIPFTTTLSLNWAYEPTDVLLASPEHDDLLINPIFERHLRKLDNWSLGPAFHHAFPGLAGTYRLKADHDRRP